MVFSQLDRYILNSSVKGNLKIAFSAEGFTRNVMWTGDGIGRQLEFELYLLIVA